jgi:hypothetical protein
MAAHQSHATSRRQHDVELSTAHRRLRFAVAAAVAAIMVLTLCHGAQS